VLAGTLHVVALRTSVGWVAWIALVPLLAFVPRASAMQTVVAAVAYTLTLALLDVAGWLVPALPRYFGLDRTTAALAGTAAMAALGTAHGLVLGGILVLRRRVRPTLGSVWCAATWSAWEGLRTALAPYFPACILGASQASALPVLQLASVTGIAGVTALVAGVNAALAALVAGGSTPTRRRAAVVSAGLVVLVAGWGAARAARAPRVDGASARVVLVDGAAISAHESTVARYIAATGAMPEPPPALVVWPESALAVDLVANTDAWRELRAFVDHAGTTLVTGGVGSAVRTGGHLVRFNSVHVVRPGHGMLSYHKRLLVPLAESWPDALGTPPAGIDPVVAGRGLGVFGDGGQRFGTVICFEIGDAATVRALARSGARFVVSVNNDVWWAGRAPHLVWAIIRAVESGLPVVRATNGGTSAVIDPVGRPIAVAPPADRPATLTSAIPEPIDTLYVRTGEVFLPACLVVVLVGLLPRRLTRRGSMAG
jgi:apolipoprotein N-acyltransferase